MFKATHLVKSPAAPAAILLYGIVFGFAMWSYLGLPWQRSHTITLYGATAVWATVVIFHRWRAIGFSINRVDILFGVFLLWVLGSVATHWWKGTIQYLEFMPFFVILPYLLGRMMVAQDVRLFKKILIGMAGALLLLLPFEYWKNNQPGFLYENSPAPIVFGQSHGTMLAGLLFSAALVVLISKIMLQNIPSAGAGSFKKRDHFFDCLLSLSITAGMIWIASRGSAVAAVLGIVALFVSSSFLGWKKTHRSPLSRSCATVAEAGRGSRR